jgi:hypothetical protein
VATLGLKINFIKWHRYKIYGTDGYNTIGVCVEALNGSTYIMAFILESDWIPLHNKYITQRWYKSNQFDHLGEVTEKEKQFIKMMMI